MSSITPRQPNHKTEISVELASAAVADNLLKLNTELINWETVERRLSEDAEYKRN